MNDTCLQELIAEHKSVKSTLDKAKERERKLRDKIVTELFPKIHQTWLDIILMVHHQLLEPKHADFYVDKIPDLSVEPSIASSIKYLHDFNFLRESDIYQKYSYNVLTGTESDVISKEEYRQHGNLVFRFAFGDRGAYGYSIRDLT